MIGYIFRRLLSLAFVLFVVSIFVFVLMNLVPGGPFTLADRGILWRCFGKSGTQIWAR